MHLRNDKRQNIQKKLDFSSEQMGEACQAGREEIESLQTMHKPENPANTIGLMEEVCKRENLLEALRRVKANKGSAGIDGRTVGQLSGYLKEHWLTIREQLLNGTYEPQPVRRVEIEKPDGGGMRKLGIPTTLDRFLQQAVMQARERGCRAHDQSGNSRIARHHAEIETLGCYLRRCTIPERTAGHRTRP